VAYDEDFAAHVRELRSGLGAVGECRVFDGRAFLICGRAMPGWVRVNAKEGRTTHQLNRWVVQGVTHAESLPQKRGLGI
jgi:hypothetical protein